jgi:hypothetical protein
MKKLESQDVTMQQTDENWITPEITVLSVKEETLGQGGGGPDFGSELGS